MSDRLSTTRPPAILARMRAIILSIGDELVLGQTVDTNSAFIGRTMAFFSMNAAWTAS